MNKHSLPRWGKIPWLVLLTLSSQHIEDIFPLFCSQVFFGSIIFSSVVKFSTLASEQSQPPVHHSSVVASLICCRISPTHALEPGLQCWGWTYNPLSRIPSWLIRSCSTCTEEIKIIETNEGASTRDMSNYQTPITIIIILEKKNWFATQKIVMS